MSTPTSSDIGGFVTADRAWLVTPNDAFPPPDAEYVSLRSTANFVSARVELTAVQSTLLNEMALAAPFVPSTSRRPWVGVSVRTSSNRLVIRRGFLWVNDDASRDARGVLDLLRTVIPVDLHAEVGRHLYAPLVGDSLSPADYLW